MWFQLVYRCVPSLSDGESLSPCLQDGARRHCLEAQGFRLPFWPLARLAQDEEPDGSEAEEDWGR
jgi:hypothetical protein